VRNLPGFCISARSSFVVISQSENMNINAEHIGLIRFGISGMLV
jgi:hypothetical protein